MQNRALLLLRLASQALWLGTDTKDGNESINDDHHDGKECEGRCSVMEWYPSLSLMMFPAATLEICVGLAMEDPDPIAECRNVMWAKGQ